MSLLDVSQDSGGNNLELICNFGLANLEVVDLLEHVSAVASALVHEAVSREEPVVLLHTGVYYFVQGRKVVIEERLLAWIDQQQNVVVVANYEHHILAQHSKLLFLAKQTREWKRESNQTEGLNLEPVLNFNKNF